VENDFENAKKLVEETIAKLGLDPATTRGPSSDAQAAWTLKRGSASVLVTVTIHEKDETFLRVASPVVTLPADKAQHGALFRRLLEINAGGLANAAFGLVGDRVVAVSERPTDGLGAEEVEQTVRHLAAVADTFDDRLEKEFGATKA
jgi:Putative bacterial sensory transduction regulator